MTNSMEPLLGKGRLHANEGQAEPLQFASWANGRITFDHRRMVCRDAELVWTAPRHLLVLTEEGGTSHTHVRVGGRVAYDGRDRPGALSFIPESADRYSTYRNARLAYSALWIDPTFQERLRGCEGMTPPPPIVNGTDTAIQSLVSSLREEVAENRRLDTAYIEHLMAVILLRLARPDRAEVPRRIRSAQLNRKALNTVQDYIEANIGADIALSDLAELVGMPVDSFARRFRATTGLPPYAFIIERRVRRAETLLRTTRREIAAIALALGFSSQSHFTTTFHRVAGTTPRAYRAHFPPKI